MNCNVCENTMKPVLQSRVLGKYRVSYFKCPECEIIKPENPHWLVESYSSAIASTDVGLVSRNLYNGGVVNAILTRLHNPATKVLDVGGGYGLLCRILRDKGWDCLTMDSYCENMLAKGFDAPEGTKADTLLAFEVFEHIEDPLSFVREKIGQHDAKRFIYSTLTHDWDVPPSDWSYYAFETGQHISLYKKKTMGVLAAKLDWHYMPITNGMHILSATPLGFMDTLLLTKRCRPVSRIYRAYAEHSHRAHPQLMLDYEVAKAGVIAAQKKEL